MKRFLQDLFDWIHFSCKILAITAQFAWIYFSQELEDLKRKRLRKLLRQQKNKGGSHGD